MVLLTITEIPVVIQYASCLKENSKIYRKNKPVSLGHIFQIIMHISVRVWMLCILDSLYSAAK